MKTYFRIAQASTLLLFTASTLSLLIAMSGRKELQAIAGGLAILTTAMALPILAGAVLPALAALAARDRELRGPCLGIVVAALAVALEIAVVSGLRR